MCDSRDVTCSVCSFFFNDTATTEIYTLSLHDVFRSRLIEAGAARGVYDDILIDQGDADSFLADQLKPELLTAAATAAGQKVTLRMQPGYDHSYFFMASFIADHVAFHARRLKD